MPVFPDRDLEKESFFAGGPQSDSPEHSPVPLHLHEDVSDSEETQPALIDITPLQWRACLEELQKDVRGQITFGRMYLEDDAAVAADRPTLVLRNPLLSLERQCAEYLVRDMHLIDCYLEPLLMKTERLFLCLQQVSSETDKPRRCSFCALKHDGRLLPGEEHFGCPLYGLASYVLTHLYNVRDKNGCVIRNKPSSLPGGSYSADKAKEFCNIKKRNGFYDALNTFLEQRGPSHPLNILVDKETMKRNEDRRKKRLGAIRARDGDSAKASSVRASTNTATASTATKRGRSTSKSKKRAGTTVTDKRTASQAFEGEEDDSDDQLVQGTASPVRNRRRCATRQDKDGGPLADFEKYLNEYGAVGSVVKVPMPYGLDAAFADVLRSGNVEWHEETMTPLQFVQQIAQVSKMSFEVVVAQLPYASLIDAEEGALEEEIDDNDEDSVYTDVVTTVRPHAKRTRSATGRDADVASMSLVEKLAIVFARFPRATIEFDFSISHGEEELDDMPSFTIAQEGGTVQSGTSSAYVSPEKMIDMVAEHIGCPAAQATAVIENGRLTTVSDDESKRLGDLLEEAAREYVDKVVQMTSLAALEEPSTQVAAIVDDEDEESWNGMSTPVLNQALASAFDQANGCGSSNKADDLSGYGPPPSLFSFPTHSYSPSRVRGSFERSTRSTSAVDDFLAPYEVDDHLLRNVPVVPEPQAPVVDASRLVEAIERSEKAVKEAVSGMGEHVLTETRELLSKQADTIDKLVEQVKTLTTRVEHTEVRAARAEWILERAHGVCAQGSVTAPPVSNAQEATSAAPSSPKSAPSVATKDVFKTATRDGNRVPMATTVTELSEKLVSKWLSTNTTV